MTLWRLARGRYPALDGEGAREYGGRWNDPEVPLAYLSEHPALCVVETLVHLEKDQWPEGYVLYRVEAPQPQSLAESALHRAWRERIEHCRLRLRSWIEKKRGLLVSVPSAVVPRARNVLLNPRHPDADQIGVVERIPFGFEPRRLRASSSA